MVNNKSLAPEEVFSALSDPTRLEILRKLSKGPLNVSEIAEPFSISIPAISKHLKILESAKLIKREVSGRVHTCSLNPKGLNPAKKWLKQQEQYWNKSFDKLEAYFNEKKH